MHIVEMVEVKNRNKKISVKPNIICDYNLAMSGIDKADQMLSYYSTLKKTIRWPKKLAPHIFELYIHNAHILYWKIKDTKKTSLKLRESFIKFLLGEDIPEDSYFKESTSKFHYLEALPPTQKKVVRQNHIEYAQSKKYIEKQDIIAQYAQKNLLCVLKTVLKFTMNNM